MKNFNADKMKHLAKAAGLDWDGGEDDRLFGRDDKQIGVYVHNTMTEIEYNKMEKEINEISFIREGYEVYAWNDCSGYIYWNKESEMNYIQIAVTIRDLNKIKLSQLKKDVDAVYKKLSKWHNVDKYIQYLNKKRG